MSREQPVCMHGIQLLRPTINKSFDWNLNRHAILITDNLFALIRDETIRYWF